MILLQMLIAAFNLYVTGQVPKILLVYQAHGVPPSHIFQRVYARRHVGSAMAISGGTGNLASLHGCACPLSPQ
jgi:hypothetical protein